MKTMLNRFDVEYFFSIPPETQIIWFWFGCFLALLIATIIIYIYLRSRGFKEKPYRAYSKNFFWPNLSLALLGLFQTFSRYESLALFSYRFWVYVTILAVLTFNAWFFIVKRSKLEDELLKFHNDVRKSKWLQKK